MQHTILEKQSSIPYDDFASFYVRSIILISFIQLPVFTIQPIFSFRAESERHCRTSYTSFDSVSLVSRHFAMTMYSNSGPLAKNILHYTWVRAFPKLEKWDYFSISRYSQRIKITTKIMLISWLQIRNCWLKFVQCDARHIVTDVTF